MYVNKFSCVTLRFVTKEEAKEVSEFLKKYYTVTLKGHTIEIGITRNVMNLLLLHLGELILQYDKEKKDAAETASNKVTSNT